MKWHPYWWLVAALLPVMPVNSSAQWNQTNDVGPYDYNDPANWTEGIINGVFTVAPPPG
jgi:hypothetical protein